MGALHLSLASALLIPMLASVPAIAAETPAPAASTDCVEAEVGHERAFTLGCLNQRLSQIAEQAHNASQPDAPIGAGSPSTTLGLANHAAAQEMMGNAFGKSATPQRPDLLYGSPLLQTGRH